MRWLIRVVFVLPIAYLLLVEYLVFGGQLPPAGLVACALVSLVFAFYVEWRNSPDPLPVDVMAACAVVTVAPVVSAFLLGAGGWPLETIWISGALASLLIARAGRMPGARRAMIAAGALAGVAAFSPLTVGLDGVYTEFWAMLFVALEVSVGIAVRFQRLKSYTVADEARRRERQMMASELHDEVAHEVTGIVVLAQALLATSHAPATRQALAKIETSGRKALDQIRSVVAALSQAAPDEQAVSVGGTTMGLWHSHLSDIRELTEQFAGTTNASATYSSNVADDAPLGGVVAFAAYRIVAEALTNVHRHAGSASRVTVRADREGDDLVVEVLDNGQGGGVGSGGGAGLAGIAERAALVGGTVTAGRVDGGWQVRARLPWQVDA